MERRVKFANTEKGMGLHCSLYTGHSSQDTACSTYSMCYVLCNSYVAVRGVSTLEDRRGSRTRYIRGTHNVQ